MISYLQFRSNALASLSLIPQKDKPKFQSKEDLENWVKSEYQRHGALYREDEKRVKWKNYLESIINYIHNLLK